jgi:ATP-dependent protease ClpP protease subunit
MHNIGSVDSVATVIFLAATRRYANPNSSFLFHGVNANFDTKTSLTMFQLKERLSALEQDQVKISNIITQYTKITFEELSNLFMQGEVKTPEYALEKGFIDEIKPLSIEPNAPLISIVEKQTGP